MPTLSLTAVLAEPGRRFPDKVALVQAERRLTYAQVWERSRQIAATLIGRGIAPGQRVALLAQNTVEFVTGYYGVLAAGATVVPVPPLLRAREAAYLLTFSGARALLVDPSVEELAATTAELAGLEPWDLATLGIDTPPLAAALPRDADDVAVVFYTAGTTGTPKGALLTHLNLVMNATVAAFDLNDFARDDILLGALPLFHVYGQTLAMNGAFRRGATLVLKPRFEPALVLETMAREHVTVFLGVPTMLLHLTTAARAGLAPLPGSLRFATCGGSPLPVKVQADFEATFGVPVYEGYGLSETSPVAIANQTDFGRRPGTVGHPIWGTEARIADEVADDRIVFLPPGERGEIVVRGHHVFAGYLDDPEASRRALVGGWFRTGDMGTIDADGYVTVVGRKTDLIIRGGLNVYPREVEEVLMRHPGVNRAAVIGVPDEVHGEEVCAVIVPMPGVELDIDEIARWARHRLGHHKYPRRIEIVDELPTTASQKVLKRRLRERYA